MGYPLLDPLAALMVAGVIVQQGVVISMKSLKVYWIGYNIQCVATTYPIPPHLSRPPPLIYFPLPSKHVYTMLWNIHHIYSLPLAPYSIIDSINALYSPSLYSPLLYPYPQDLSDIPATAEETEELKKTCLQVKGIISVDQILGKTPLYFHSSSLLFSPHLTSSLLTSSLLTTPHHS